MSGPLSAASAAERDYWRRRAAFRRQSRANAAALRAYLANRCPNCQGTGFVETSESGSSCTECGGSGQCQASNTRP